MRLLIFLSFWIPLNASAGIFEVGLNGMYKKSTIDDYTFEEKKEIGASISYYFWAQSAIEFSYTADLKLESLGTATDRVEQQTEEAYYGADFVLSLTEVKAPIRPYIKAGTVYIHKKSITQRITPPTVDPAITTEIPDGWAPSAGIGIKIGLTETMSLKLGIETWNLTQSDGRKKYDYAGRAGLSWLF